MTDPGSGSGSGARVSESEVGGSRSRRESVNSPQCWGYESPSMLNREVSNILSRGNPPVEDERHKWTHPSPVQPQTQPQAHHASSRPVSCPLYPNSNPMSVSPGHNKKFVSPSTVTVSPFQLSDQSQELRNHLYQAAYQHHSPFRFPFLPVNRYFQSLPPSPLRLPYPFPYPGYPPSYPFTSGSGPDPSLSRDSPHGLKRKHSEEANPNVKSDIKDGKDKKEAKERRETLSFQSPSFDPNPSNCNNNSSPYFRAGSMIQLASGHMKKVEDLNTDDFVTSAATCPDICIDKATVSRLDQNPETYLFSITFSVGRSSSHSEFVTVNVSPDHPFFVTEQGWSSCSPSLSMSHYNLSCSQLTVGDVCISLRHTSPSISNTSSTPDITADTRPKQVRFQDSPVPLKKKRVSSTSEVSSIVEPAIAAPPVSISFRVSSVSDPAGVTMTSEQTISNSVSAALRQAVKDNLT